MSNSQIIKDKVKHPGLYGSVNLNGWTLISEEKPLSDHSVLLGYRAPHIPEVWFGVGYRDGDRYWLGPRGLDPHYCPLDAADVIIWLDYQKPFCFDDGSTGTSEYLQWRYILGEEIKNA
jgi:hypothetical protein